MVLFYCNCLGGDGFGVSVASSSFDAFGPDAFAAPSTAEFDAFGDDGFASTAAAVEAGGDDGFGAVLSATSNDLLDGLDDDTPCAITTTSARPSTAPAAVVSSQNAASLFNPFEDDELTSSALDFPPAHPSWTSNTALARSSSAPVSNVVAMLDIFGDDLLTPGTAATTPGSGASTITTNFSNSDNFSVKKPRNPLDVLSLYDTAPPSSAPKNAMMGSAPAKPMKPFTPGVSPMAGGTGMGQFGMGSGSSSGMGSVGGRTAGMSTSTQKPGPSSGLPLTADSFSLGLSSAPAPLTQQGSGGWGASPSGNRGMGMGMAGRPQQFQANPHGSVGSRQQQQQSSDPFDTINMFKR